MNIVVPDILAGGMGRAMQQTGQTIASSITAVGGGVQKVVDSVSAQVEAYEREQKVIKDQQAYVEATKLGEAVTTAKENAFQDAKSNLDPSDIDNFRKTAANIDQLGKEIANQSSNPEVRRHAEEVNATSQWTYEKSLEGVFMDRLRQESSAANDQHVNREMAQASNDLLFFKHAMRVGDLIDSQKDFWGEEMTESLKMQKMSQLLRGAVYEAFQNGNAKTMYEIARNPIELDRILNYVPGNADEMRKIVQNEMKNIDAANILEDLKTRYIENPANAYFKDGTEKNVQERWEDAYEELTSPEFAAKHDPETLRRAQETRIREDAALRRVHQAKAATAFDELPGKLLSREIGVQDLTKDPNWRYLSYAEKKLITGYAWSLLKADNTESVQTRRLDMYELQEYRQKQQQEADKAMGGVLTKIADGTYTGNYRAEVLRDLYRTNNPYILYLYGQATTLFNKIQSSPDLKDGIRAIDDAARDGVLHFAGPDQNLTERGVLQKEFLARYESDPTFRGEKSNKWVKEKVQAKAEKAIGKWLDTLVFGK